MTLTQNYPQLKKLPYLLTTLLVIFLGIVLAKLLWMILTPEQNAALKPATAQKGVTDQPKRQPNYGHLIANQHLFGEIEKEVVPLDAPPPEAKPVEVYVPPPVVIPKLNVQLHGIMSYNKKDTGYALLTYEGQGQKVYAVGEYLADKVVITKITADKVVIGNHGSLEEFVLPITSYDTNGIAILANSKKKEKPETTTAEAPPSAMSATSAPPPPSSVPLPNASFSSSQKTMGNTGDHNPNDYSIEHMAQFREKAMADPSKLMEVASASPYKKNGELLGFRVRPGKQRKFFRQLGLRNGDVITEINGVKLDNMANSMSLMGTLSGASELKITVLRASREIPLPTLNF